MGRRLGVLVHGAGWVSTQHTEAFGRNPHTEVVAISSRKIESARRRAAEAGLDVPCFSSLEKALRTPGVDIVSICTPQHVHAENVLAAAAAGKHLVIEKPVGNSPAELQAIEIYGDRGTVRDNRIGSHRLPGQTGWVQIPTILPGSSDVTHHPFQAQMDHFVECVQQDRGPHCNLEDAVHTHEVVFAAQECYRTGRPVRLPLG